jgi:hypothetical protein
MVWNSSHIFWQEQLLVLAIVLPPVFISAALIALSAPRLFAAKQLAKRGGKEALPAGSPALPNSR